MSKKYVKDIYSEPWDDQQCKSVQIGGNEKLFNIWKEYQILDMDINKRYMHPATTWYIQKHKHLFMNDVSEDSFTVPPPPKNFKEKVKRTQETFGAGLKNMDENFNEDMNKLTKDTKSNLDTTGQKAYQSLSYHASEINRGFEQAGGQKQLKQFDKNVN